MYSFTGIWVLRRIIKYFSITFLVISLLIVALWVWLLTGSRSIPYFQTKLEQYVAKFYPDYQLSLGDHGISYHWDTHEFHLSINDLHLQHPEKTTKETILAVGKIDLYYDPLSLLVLQFVPGSVELYDPRLSLYTDFGVTKKISETNRTESVDDVLPIDLQKKIYHRLNSLLTILRNSQRHSQHVERFGIYEGELHLVNSEHAQTIFLQEITGQVSVSQDHNTVLLMDIMAGLNEQHFSFTNEILLSNDAIITSKTYFNDISLNAILQQIPKEFVQKFKGIDQSRLLASGYLSFFLSPEEGIEHMQAEINSPDGVITLSNIMDSSVKFKDMQINCTILRHFRELNCQQFSLNINNQPISGSMDIAVTSEAITTNLLLNLTTTSMDNLYQLWPTIVATRARKWVFERVKKGMVSKADAAFTFRKPLGEAKQKIQLDHLDIHAELEQATFLYNSEIAPLEEVNATIIIDNTSLKGDIHSAKLGNSYFRDSHIHLPDYRQFSLMTLKGTFQGAIQDITPLITAFYPKPLKLLDASIQAVKGDMRVEYSLSLPLNKEKKSEIDYRVNASIKQLGIPQLYHTHNATGEDMDLVITPEKITVDGTMTLASIKGLLAVEHYTQEEHQHESRYAFNSELFAMDDLQQLGFPANPYIRGKLQVSTEVRSKGNARSIAVKANLGQSQISLQSLGLYKQAGVPLQAGIAGIIPSKGPITIPELKIYSDQVMINGNASLNASSFLLESLNLKQFKTPTNDFTLSLEHQPSRLSLNLSGKKIDLSSIDLFGLMKQGDTKKKQAKNIRITMDEILLKNLMTLQTVKGNIQCGLENCHYLDVTANINQDHRFLLSYQPQANSMHELKIESDNAGALLKALDLTNKMKGGELKLHANYDQRNKNERIEGEAVIRKFTLYKTPVLAKLLTLASLKGVVDMLEGNGIEFKRLNMPFMIENDTIRLIDNKTFGSSIGLTLEGTIDTKKDILDLTGTVIPAYLVSRAIGDIPLVGELLTGGNDGGVVAVNYKVKGSTHDPKVSVNPLSILTPGFLRKLFDAPAPPKVTNPTQPTQP